MNKKQSTIAAIGDEYCRQLTNGNIGKTMKKLFAMDKHHLFTPFKMGFYCAVLLTKEQKIKWPPGK